MNAVLTDLAQGPVEALFKGLIKYDSPIGAPRKWLSSQMHLRGKEMTKRKRKTKRGLWNAWMANIINWQCPKKRRLSCSRY